MFTSIQSYCDKLRSEFQNIPEDRKKILNKISDYIRNKHAAGQKINLVYICTHNSRRSHFGQIWAKVAGDYYQLPNIQTYSGGMEVTAFNLNAINALKKVGFKITADNNANNPIYNVVYGDQDPIRCFSKTFDHPDNPGNNFAAIMTCSDAEENCPFVPGADLKVSTTYADPKNYDGSPLQDAKYDERCRQIALETFYIFSQIK